MVNCQSQWKLSLRQHRFWNRLLSQDRGMPPMPSYTPVLWPPLLVPHLLATVAHQLVSRLSMDGSWCLYPALVHSPCISPSLASQVALTPFDSREHTMSLCPVY